MSEYNTGNPVPSSSMPDAWDNNATVDEFVNSDEITLTTRTGAERDTMAGIQKKANDQRSAIESNAEEVIDDTRQNLIPLSKQYMTLSEAQADIANIPVGSTTYYRSPDDSALAIEVINNAGTLSPTGRKMPSQEAVEQATDPLRKSINLLNESSVAFGYASTSLAKTISATMKRIYDFSSSGTKSFTLDSDGILAINRIVDASPPNVTLTVNNNGVQIASLTVLPGDTLTSGESNSLWFLVSSLSGKRPSSVAFQGTVARIVFAKEDFPDINGVDTQPDQYRAADKTYAFVAETANNAPSSTVPCVSNTATGDIQFCIPVSLITSAGYPSTSDGVIEYFLATHPELNIWCRPPSTSTERWKYNDISVIALAAGTVAITIDSSVSTIDLSVFSGKALDYKSPELLREGEFRTGDSSRNVLFSGYIGDLGEVTSNSECTLSVDSMVGLSSSTAGRIDVLVDGLNHSTLYMPGFGAVLDNGKLIAPFKRLSLVDCALYRLAELTPSVARMQFTIPANITTAFSQQTSEYVVDLSGVFAPGSYSQGSSVTYSTISGTTTATPRVIQLNVLVSELQGAGVNTGNIAEIEAFIRGKASKSQFLIYTGTTLNEISDVSRFFSRRLPAGTISLAYSNNNASGFVSLKNQQDTKPVAMNMPAFMSGDILNDTAYDYANYPMEMKVKFQPGVVGRDNALYLVDGSGAEIACQFADEGYPNQRNQVNMGYNLDGSLGSGSVVFYDSLLAGEHKYYELKAYSRAKAPHELPVITSSSNALNVEFGGYTYTFNPDRYWGLDSVTDSNGVVTKLQHSNQFAAYTTSATQTPFNLNPAARVVAVGPVFVEVETVAFNAASGALAARSLKATTRTRIYKNGKLHFRSAFTAVAEIPVNTLWGTHSRISLPEIYIVPGNKSYFTLLNTDAVTGNIWTFCLLRGTGDTHRDGVQYGPNRPNYWNVINPSSASTRLYGGWQYVSTTDYSLLNWPVNKNWTWTTEFFVDAESPYSTELDMLTSIYNRPGGRLGAPVYPGTLRRRLFRQFEDYCAGSMEWFRSAAAQPYGGSSYILNRYYCHTWDIYQYYAHNKGTLQTVYANFKAYCESAWGSFDDIGSRYTAGVLGLQLASRLVIPAHHWLYRAAERDGDTAIMASVSGSMGSFALALKTYLDSHSGVALVSTDGGGGNSNSNATASRVFALAIVMGADSAGAYQTAFNTLNTLLSGATYNYVNGVITEGPNNVLNAYNWLHYQAYAMNNYLIACDLLGVTPALDMSNYFLQAQNGSGGFNEIPYSVSESRRGQPNTITFVSYPLIRTGRSSAMVAMDALWQQFEEQHNAQAGLTRRIYGFDPTSNNMDRYEVSFNVAVLVDSILSFDK